MILTCPSCAARYFTDDSSIGANGRTVRCAACTHSWFVEPHLLLSEASGVAFDDDRPLTREKVERMRRAAAGANSAPMSSAARFRAQQAERQRKDRVRASLFAWGATGVALAATTTSAVAFREDVARVWPKSASAYAAVGLPVNIFGLEFVDLQIEHVYDSAEPALLVRGAVRNMGHNDLPAPVLRFGLRDARANEIQHVLARMATAKVPAGGAAPFEIRIENPSMESVDIEATFASEMEADAMPLDRAALAATNHRPETHLLDPPASGELILDPVAHAVDEDPAQSQDDLAPRLSEPWPQAGENG